jgi:hypothetical protein
MKPNRWVPIDTRKFGDRYDGFVHIVPRAMAQIHELCLDCWCDTKAIWLEDAGTVLVSHRDKRPSAKSEWQEVG